MKETGRAKIGMEEPPPETPQQDAESTPQTFIGLICPKCGEDPVSPVLVQYQTMMPDGHTAVMHGAGCSKCRHLLPLQFVGFLPPKTFPGAQKDGRGSGLFLPPRFRG